MHPSQGRESGDSQKSLTRTAEDEVTGGGGARAAAAAVKALSLGLPAEYDQDMDMDMYMSIWIERHFMLS